MRQHFPEWFFENIHPYYCTGLLLDKGIGNNSFSLDRKPQRSPLRITPLMKGSFGDLQVSDQITFHDFDEDKWVECSGLEKALLCLDYEIPIYVFDNHNHAFYGWCEGLMAGWFQKGATLVHVDAHYDDAVPPNIEVNIDDLKDVFRYTNEVLQIATFINPALELGIFDEVRNYVESKEFGVASLELGEQKQIVLDIDLDVFCTEMSHVEFEQKMEVIRKYLPQTKLITMATSPFFIDQEKAIRMAKRITEEMKVAEIAKDC
ncbi:MAG: UPF0489 family protein [Candidatus Gracilibacteria bacterium]|nr:UPF0489 family protein [Candidatus Gracilibacteria bacterium]